jgi:hypothetical protein
MKDEQNTIFHDEKTLLKQPVPCFVGHAVKIVDFCSHIYSRISVAFHAIFLLNSDNRKEDLQFPQRTVSVHAKIVDNEQFFGFGSAPRNDEGTRESAVGVVANVLGVFRKKQRSGSFPP